MQDQGQGKNLTLPNSLQGNFAVAASISEGINVGEMQCEQTSVKNNPTTKTPVYESVPSFDFHLCVTFEIMESSENTPIFQRMLFIIPQVIKPQNNKKNTRQNACDIKEFTCK